MSNTFEELRADLARFVGMFHTGTVENGTDEVIIDLGGTAHITEADALNGGLAYIRTASAAAPEGESQRVSDYKPVTPAAATELLSNGGFETAGAGGADVFATWVESAGDGTITQDASEVAGDWSAKLLAGATANTAIKQASLVVEPGEPYLLTLWHFAGDGTPGRYSLFNVNGYNWIPGHGSMVALDYVAHWEFATIGFVAPKGCTEVELWLHCPETDGDACRYDVVSVQQCGGIYLADKLTTDVAEADVYEVYLAPLSLAQWNQAINDAIKAAWPQVFSRELWDTASREVSEYPLPDDVEGVLEVAVAFRGQYAGEPTQTIPRHLWRVEGTPGTDFNLQLHRIIPPHGRDLHVYYKAKYAELAAGESSDIDHEYVMLAGAAKLYHMLAAEAGPQSGSARYLQLLNYYDKEAKERRDLLEADLLGLPIEARRERGGRKK